MKRKREKKRYFYLIVGQILSVKNDIIARLYRAMCVLTKVKHALISAFQAKICEKEERKKHMETTTKSSSNSKNAGRRSFPNRRLKEKKKERIMRIGWYTKCVHVNTMHTLCESSYQLPKSLTHTRSHSLVRSLTKETCDAMWSDDGIQHFHLLLDVNGSPDDSRPYDRGKTIRLLLLTAAGATNKHRGALGQ